MNRVALLGGTVYRDPFEQPMHDGLVLVEAQTIASVDRRGCVDVPAGTQIFDCSGCTVTAGFWNSHVHFFERKWADAARIPADELQRQLEQTFTRFGFTSVFDTGSQWRNTRVIRDRVASGEVDGPDIRSTGEALLPPGALPSPQVLGALGYMQFAAPEIADAVQASAAAAQLLAAGVDGIKIFPSSPRSGKVPDDAIAAAANLARAAGKPVFAHPDTGEDVIAAVNGGVDIIAHTTPQSGPWDEALVALMKNRGVALTPTLTLWKTLMRHDRISVQERLTQTAVAQLRAWHAAGGATLFGTDLGAADADPAPEYALMASAGLSYRDILACLTVNACDRFGKRSGRVVPGQEASLTVLNGNPADVTGAFAQVRYVFKRGKLVYRTP